MTRITDVCAAPCEINLIFHEWSRLSIESIHKNLEQYTMYVDKKSFNKKSTESWLFRWNVSILSSEQALYT